MDAYSRDQKMTLALLGITALVWLAWDIWIIGWYGRQASISDVLYLTCQRHPFVAAGIGILVGHSLWR